MDEEQCTNNQPSQAPVENSSPAANQQDTKDDDNDSQWSLSSVSAPELQQLQQQQDDDMDLEPTSKFSLHQQYSQATKQPPPQKPEVKKQTGIFKIGKLMTFVEDFMIVEATDEMVLDLDNYVLNKEKEILGYIVDVFGPVGKPFYSIRLEGTVNRTEMEIGMNIYFCAGSKLLGKMDIQKLKVKGQKDAVQAEQGDSSSDDDVPDNKSDTPRKGKRDYQRAHSREEHHRPINRGPPGHFRDHQQHNNNNNNQGQWRRGGDQRQSNQTTHPRPHHHLNRQQMHQISMDQQAQQQMFMNAMYQQYYQQMLGFCQQPPRPPM